MMMVRYAPNSRFVGNGTSGLLDDWAPAADVLESPTHLTFELDLPGFSQQDIEVEMIEDVLTVKGKREKTINESDGNYNRVERRFGTFERSFKIRVPVRAEEITANYKDGVLTVVVPKAPEAQPRKILVNSN